MPSDSETLQFGSLITLHTHTHLSHVLLHDDVSARVEYNLDVLRISSACSMVVDFTPRVFILGQELL